MRGVGSVLAAFGFALAARSALLLLGLGRPRRGAKPVFVLAGPYRYTRNPLLAGGVLTLAGIACACASPSLALLAITAAASAHLWVTRIEEPRLSDRLGAAYREYLRHVPRWLPEARGRGRS